MNRIVNLCLPVAVCAMMLSQIPGAQGADNKKGVPRGGGGGGGGRPAAVTHVSAPAHFAARSGGMSTGRTFASRNVTGRSSISGNRVSSTMGTRFNRGSRNLAVNRNLATSRNLAANRTRTGIAGTTGITRGRQLARLNGNTNRLTGANRFNTGPIGANRINGAAGVNRTRFGGAGPASTIASTQFAFRAGNFNPGWNPGRTYFWNDCHWRCFDGVWAVVNIGWPYDWYAYPYPFMYDDVVYYRGDVYEPGPAIGSNLAADVQSSLANQGYNPGPVDGVVGPRTSEAIAEYQGDHGMTPTGRIDTPLLQSLGLQ